MCDQPQRVAAIEARHARTDGRLGYPMSRANTDAMAVPAALEFPTKYRVAMLRAAWNVLKHDPDWAVWTINAQGGGYVFVNQANVASSTLGHMLGCNGSHIIYRAEKRARRPPAGQWVRVRGMGGARKQLPAGRGREFVPDRERLLALDPGSSRRIAEEQVADHIAYRDGTPEVREAVQAKRDAAWAHTKLLYDRAMGRASPDDNRYQAHDVTGMETVTVPLSLVASLRTDLAAIASTLRALAVQNDPEAVRSGWPRSLTRWT